MEASPVLPATLRELVILRSAHFMDCGYPFSSRTSSTAVSETRGACRQLRPIT
jgi:hypothetical protein